MIFSVLTREIFVLIFADRRSCWQRGGPHSMAGLLDCKLVSVFLHSQCSTIYYEAAVVSVRIT
jgi:hypothetical protein